MPSDDEQELNSYNFILDPSALAYGGVGKIKQWVDTHTADQPNITFYVPHYTLRELDFLKKVFNPLISMNARESIRFIDNQFSNENEDVSEIADCENGDDDYGDFESFNACKNQKLRNEKNKKNIQFILESSTDSGPDWRKASGFRRYTPLISELPNPINGKSNHGLMSKNGKGTVGVFGNNIPGSFKNVTNRNDFFENQNIHHNHDSKNTKVDDKAVIPRRLKFLIRSCIQKQYIENKETDNRHGINWIVICEDPTTCIWLKCFGLTIMTLNEVENIFEKFSGTHNNVLYDPDSGSLVQTTKNDYKRERYGAGRGRGRGSCSGKGRGKGCKQNSIKTNNVLKKNDEVGTEEKAKCASTDEYAPRASGELWTG